MSYIIDGTVDRSVDQTCPLGGPAPPPKARGTFDYDGDARSPEALAPHEELTENQPNMATQKQSAAPAFVHHLN